MWRVLTYATMLLFIMGNSCVNFFIKGMGLRHDVLIVTSSCMGFGFAFRSSLYLKKIRPVEQTVMIFLSMCAGATWAYTMWRGWIANLCACICIFASYLFNAPQCIERNSFDDAPRATSASRDSLVDSVSSRDSIESNFI